MSSRCKPIPFVALLAVLSACDSSSPSDEWMLHVRGEVIEAGEVPGPPLARTGCVGGNRPRPVAAKASV